MKKVFLTELIADDYQNWGRRKIIIQAQTGMGKTHFLVKTLLPYYRSRKKKVLILCNRRLLRQQYLYSLIGEFDTYSEMEEAVKIDTYQSLADALANGAEPGGLLLGFDVVLLDEFHYFYSDSEFNGFGTYALFQALMISGMHKTMVFVSATAKCTESYVKEYVPKSKRFLEGKYLETGYFSEDECLQVRMYDFSSLIDYSYITCILAPDMETLVLEMAKSQKKCIIFLDDKEKAEKLKEIICQKGKVPTKDVRILNADMLDARENDTLIEKMTLANELGCRVLITTSVLDNGVSIKDEDVENLAVLTESQVSFLQMVGRIRIENDKRKINLFFCPNTAEYYARREQQAKELLDLVTNIKGKMLNEKEQIKLLRMSWHNPEDREMKMLRTVLTLVPPNCDFFTRLQAERVYLRFRGSQIAVNEFAVRKIGDMYKAEAEFHKLARQNPLKVVYKQMEWLRKEASELQILPSTYQEEQCEELIEELCKIQGCDLETLREVKRVINEKYGKTLLSDIVIKRGSFSREKFEEILDRYGLRLEVKNDAGRNLYSVKKGESKDEKGKSLLCGGFK